MLTTLTNADYGGRSWRGDASGKVASPVGHCPSAVPVAAKHERPRLHRPAAGANAAL